LISCNHTQKKDIVNDKAEITSLYVDLDGNSIAIKDFKGKRVLLNFWATWCTPCLKEMPSMEIAQELLKNENYVFLFATTDNLEKINQFKKNNRYPFQFLQFKSTLDKLKIYALPATFIYDTKGNQVKRIDGATEWDSKETLTLLRTIK
jgi:thiol-disulfide isomerase/thioredoxin